MLGHPPGDPLVLSQHQAGPGFRQAFSRFNFQQAGGWVYQRQRSTAGPGQLYGRLHNQLQGLCWFQRGMNGPCHAVQAGQLFRLKFALAHAVFLNRASPVPVNTALGSHAAITGGIRPAVPNASPQRSKMK